MKKNIITLSLILLSVICFAQEMESKWYAGLSSTFNQSFLITELDGSWGTLEVESIDRSVFVSPYIGRKILKRYDVGFAYELLWSSTLNEYPELASSTQTTTIAHTVSYFNRFKLIHRKRFSLDLMGFMGIVQQRIKVNHESAQSPNSFESISPWEIAISGRGTLGVNYDLGSKWRIRLAKDFLEYWQDDLHEFKFLYKLDAIYFVVEYRF